MLEADDRKLLRYWQAEPSLSHSELAERAGMTAGRAARRIGRLQEAGLVQGVGADIDWAVLGYAVEVSLRVTLDKTQGNAFDVFMAQAREVPEVVELQTFLGRVDVRLSIIARDMAHYQEIYRNHVLTLPHIAGDDRQPHIYAPQECL